MGGSSRPFDGGGGGWFPKKFFLALQASVWSKNKGGGQGRDVAGQECGSGGGKLSNVWQKNLQFNIALQRAKKVVSDSPGLVEIAIGLVNSVFNLPDGQVMLFEEFE